MLIQLMFLSRFVAFDLLSVILWILLFVRPSDDGRKPDILLLCYLLLLIDS